MKALRIIAVFLLASLTACRRDSIVDGGGKSEPTPYYQYGIGSMSITTEDGKSVNSKDIYLPCSVNLNGGEVFESWYYMKGRIKGRGNSTWFWYPKKPYRIKLDAGTPLMGMDANKDWVLLADFRDVTHIMNNVAFTLSYELGLPCANHSRYVTLTLNDVDMGLYMLTEQVEEGRGRVRLDEEEGILLALDMNDGPGENPGATGNFYSSVFKTACAVKYPGNPSAETLAAVRAAYALLESAIGQRRWTDIQSLLDVDSMIAYILVQEIIGNGELDNNPSMRSGYIHRYDSSSKWVMGPFWDADAGFGYDASDMFNHNGMCHTFFKWNGLVFGTEPYLHKDAMNGTASDLFCRLWGIPEFVKALKSRWNGNKQHLLDATLENIDRTEEVIGMAARHDVERWNIDKFTHPVEVNKLKNWLRTRFSYLDTVINAYPEKQY